MSTTNATAAAAVSNADRAKARRAARVEDAEFMARTGESIPGAAGRLGITPDTLRGCLSDAGRSDVWAVLQANTRAGAGARQGRIAAAGRRSAA